MNPSHLRVTEQRPQRQLSAILAADVAGYSRLIGLEEEGTLARLKELRRTVIDPKITEHRGRIVKTMGDGLLVQFASAVDAVRCAGEAQREIAKQHGETAEDRRIEFRMGINVGDIVIDGDDIYGEGVNVAARLEGLSEPGGLCVSTAVYDQVRDKLDLSFEDTGEHQLKNIARPMRVYRALMSPAKPKSAAAPPSKPSIAVLPFINMSGDPEQTYFSDGITEDILTELSRFRALSVIARNSSFRFRGGDVDVVRVGRELNVQYVLEGSVRKMGDKIRITAQLIDATTGSHVWADRYDRTQEEIFNVQDQVVRMIVGTLAGRIEAAGVEKAVRKPPSSLAAYDCVLRADALPFSNPEARAEVRRLSEKAIELDPSYGRAYSQLAISYYLEWVNDYSGSDAALDEAYSLANKAIALDDNDSQAFSFLGVVHMMRRSYDLSEHCLKKAIALNPNRPVVMTSLGLLYGYLGRPDDGIACFEQAKSIDQFYEPTWYWPTLGTLHFMAGRYDEAIVHLSRSRAMPPWVHAYLAASFAHTDRNVQAEHHAGEVVRLTPGFSAVRFLTKEPFKQSAGRDHLLEGLRKAGLPQ
jgi:TolB-like protein/Tfp pilus assembly protein PilF